MELDTHYTGKRMRGEVMPAVYGQILLRKGMNPTESRWTLAAKLGRITVAFISGRGAAW